MQIRKTKCKEKGKAFFANLRDFKICQHWNLPQNEKLVIWREQAIYSPGSSKPFQLVTKAFCFCTPPNCSPLLQPHAPACSLALALASITSLPGLFQLVNVTENKDRRGIKKGCLDSLQVEAAQCNGQLLTVTMPTRNTKPQVYGHVILSHWRRCKIHIPNPLNQRTQKYHVMPEKYRNEIYFQKQSYLVWLARLFRCSLTFIE